MANRRITIEIAGDATGAQKAFDSADKSAKGFEGSISGVAKGVATSVGSAFALDQIVTWGRGFVSAAEESQKVSAQTTAVIKSMGGAANVTADQAAGLAEELSGLTGVDDELIQSGENVLMTFGQIRNEVGAGNDIFDRATAAALDLSVALGTDMTSASMLVGKALNDPIRGLTALRRSGIQFTEQQREQIEAMVEAGDVAGAQKIMLEELERQFGGSAEAQATASDKMRVAWGNFQEDVGGKLIPVVGAASEALSGMFEGPAGDIAATATAVSLGIGGIAAVAGTVIGPLKTAKDALNSFGGANVNLGSAMTKVAGAAALGAGVVGIVAWAMAADNAKFDVDQLTEAMKSNEAAARETAQGGLLVLEAWGHLDDRFAEVLPKGREMADMWIANAEAAGLSDETIAALRQQQADYEGTVESTTDSQERQRDVTQEATAAFQDQADAIRAQFDPLFGMLDAMNSVGDAGVRVTEAQTALNEAIAAGDPTAIAQAQGDYDRALQGSSRAIVSEQSAQLALNEAVAAGDVNLEDAQSSLYNWAIAAGHTAEEALIMAGDLGEASSAASWLDAQNVDVPVAAPGLENVTSGIVHLGQMLALLPTSKTVSVFRGRAAGGPVEAGQPYVTGEAGWELMVPEVDGRVLSHADSMRAVRNAGGGAGSLAPGGGGDTFVFDLSGAIIAGESQFRQMVASAWNDAAAVGAVHVRGRRVE